MARQQKLWTEYEINFLERNAHLSLDDIAFLLDRSFSSVANKFTKLGITRPHKQLTECDISYILNHYDSSTASALSRHLDLSVTTVTRFLKKRGLLREKEDRVPFFKRDCDSNYAYILGWLSSDGSVNRDNGHLKLSISYEDGQYLFPYMKNVYHWAIGVSHQNDPVRQTQMGFRCCSKDVVNFLCDEWEFDRKSYYLSNNFTNFLLKAGDECVRCFLRGFFEGDGCAAKNYLGGHITKRYTYDWTNFTKLIPNNIKYSFQKYFNKCGTVPGGSRLMIGVDFFKYIYNTDFKAALPRKKNIVLAHFAKPYYKEKYGELECPS